jgi:hypothetical protein
VLETAVNFDLPVFADEMVSVRRHDLNLVTDVDKLSRRGHPAIGIDAEIWRVLWHPDLSIDRERIQNQKKLLAIPSGIHRDHRNQRNFVSEGYSDNDPRLSGRFHTSCVQLQCRSVCFEKVLYVRHP